MNWPSNSRVCMGEFLFYSCIGFRGSVASERIKNERRENPNTPSDFFAMKAEGEGCLHHLGIGLDKKGQSFKRFLSAKHKQSLDGLPKYVGNRKNSPKE